jgi:hypothetical protein
MSNVLKGETTVERYSKRPKRIASRGGLMESPRRKLIIDLTEAEDPTNHNCV